MEKLNDVTIELAVRAQALALKLQDEEGNEAAQAAGVAMAAAILITALLGGAGKVAGGITKAFGSLANMLH